MTALGHEYPWSTTFALSAYSLIQVIPFRARSSCISLCRTSRAGGSSLVPELLNDNAQRSFISRLTTQLWFERGRRSTAGQRQMQTNHLDLLDSYLSLAIGRPTAVQPAYSFRA